MMMMLLIMLTLFQLFLMSFSLINSLILLILTVLVNSIIIYLNSMSWWISYLLILSIISGLVVVVSFVMMICPKDKEIQSSLNYNTLYFIFMNFLFISFDNSFVYSYIYNVDNQMMMNNLFCLYPYMYLFIFLLVILLLMLFVIDSIIISSGGSMMK
uniref:NADH dehydrogenase subunit 6 n=1 Tax=Anatoecus icterodes TaxID=1195957 RepID=UPI00211E347F|nr:NADH dehydrogenase subunit 6 [Anatoecus icterodes]YP_010605967.1 NADH dehydrogenase subunit 6 [Anatoecus dentatus]UTT72535.1 NADH dehydrogenase subunit 6 [Anatoecus icterodes]WAN81286.1 NADH dehydrogenase subunit 6 [Anatoecus dentatus]